MKINGNLSSYITHRATKILVIFFLDFFFFLLFGGKGVASSLYRTYFLEILRFYQILKCLIIELNNIDK